VLTLPAVAVAPTFAAPAAPGVRSTTLGSPGVPFGFLQPLEPPLTTGAAGDEQLAFITPLASVPAEAMAKTAWVDLGKPGVDKEFLDFIWNGESDYAAGYEVSYSINGNAWQAAAGDGGYEFPDHSHGKTIAIRVRMWTTDASTTPRFDDITVEWKKWTGEPSKPDGDGSGESHKPNAGHNGGSGVYTYPSTQQAPARTSVQSTSGAGASAGSGSGSGPSDAAGSGSGVARATTAEPAPEVAATTVASEVPAPPVESLGEGAPTQVTGVLSDQGRQVSGIPYTPSEGSGSAGGRGTAPGARSGPKMPFLLIAAAVVLAVTLFLPWLFTAAALREITGYNERRARAGGPFGPVAR
jgi:hypothetical protein